MLIGKFKALVSFTSGTSAVITRVFENTLGDVGVAYVATNIKVALSGGFNKDNTLVFVSPAYNNGSDTPAAPLSVSHQVASEAIYIKALGFDGDGGIEGVNMATCSFSLLIEEYDTAEYSETT